MVGYVQTRDGGDDRGSAINKKQQQRMWNVKCVGGNLGEKVTRRDTNVLRREGSQ